jgi:hypothetical protein
VQAKAAINLLRMVHPVSFDGCTLTRSSYSNLNQEG